MKKMLFIFRSFNDLDHMTPVLDKSLECHPKETVIACINPNFDLKNDFRVYYIEDKHRVKIKYIYDLYSPTLKHKLFSFLTNSLSMSTFPHNGKPSIKSKIRNRIYNSRLKTYLYNVNWFNNLVQHKNIGIVIVDYGSRHKFIYNTINSVCKTRNIPIVGMPHGLDSADNDFWTNQGNLDQDRTRMDTNWGWIDNFIVASENVKSKYSRVGIKENKMRVLGNPRFSKAWHNTYKTLIGANPIPDQNPNLKLVFFDHSIQYRSNPDEIYESLNAIDKLSFTDLVIKPHTRAGLSDTRLTTIGRVSQEHSLHLIEWADVIINYMSSIVFDAYYLNKIFIYPSHFNENTMIWEKYNACWKVSSTKDLTEAISQIYEGDYNLPYSSTDVDIFLNHQVNGGHEGSDPSSSYLSCIKETIRS